MEDVASAGYQVLPSAAVESAVHRVLHQLYLGQALPTLQVTDLIPLEEVRNAEIYQRYVNGERTVDLAEDYNVSPQRIYRTNPRRGQYRSGYQVGLRSPVAEPAV